MGINLAAFEKELNAHKETINKELVDYEKKITEETLKKIIEFSPYYTGSYISSIKIGIDMGTIAFNLFPLGTVTKSSAEGIAKGQLLKLAALKEPKNIYITNNVPYAPFVEYGWGHIGGRSGYYPFTKAENHMRTKHGL